jgi:pimeloyl-ACP methyl ester carboxylesterase
MTREKGSTGSSHAARYVERGSGPPLVFVTSMQGRWEYAEPTIDALARDFHVVAFSLCDEPSARFPFDRSHPIDSYVSQIDAAIDRLGVPRAIVCGVSFGGLLALRFAATRPERVSALIVASAPGPGWRLRPKHEVYARLPWLFGPLFLVESPWRLRHEIRAALPDLTSRWAFRLAVARTLLSAPISMSRMAARARLIAAFDVERDCARVTAPTLVVTGEPALDSVVRVETTIEIARRIQDARSVVLERSGHAGTITRPGPFAEIVRRFVAGERHAAA